MPVGSKEMTVGSLVDRHLKESAKCRTVYEVAEEEKKKSNAARLFGGALTTAPQSKPDGGSSDCGTKASSKVNLGALESNSSSILAGFELLGQQMHLMHKEAMSRMDFLENRLAKGMGSMQQQIKSMQQQQQPQPQAQQKQQQQKQPAALTAVTNLDNLVRYYPVLQCTPRWMGKALDLRNLILPRPQPQDKLNTQWLHLKYLWRWARERGGIDIDLPDSCWSKLVHIQLSQLPLYTRGKLPSSQF